MAMKPEERFKAIVNSQASDEWGRTETGTGAVVERLNKRRCSQWKWYPISRHHPDPSVRIGLDKRHSRNPKGAMNQLVTVVIPPSSALSTIPDGELAPARSFAEMEKSAGGCPSLNSCTSKSAAACARCSGNERGYRRCSARESAARATAQAHSF